MKVAITKQIQNYEDYSVSRYGDIYSSKSNKFISQFTDNLGYNQVILYREGKRCYKRVHRIVGETFIDNPQNYNMLNHINGNKQLNTTDNLEWCNNSQNIQHSYNTLRNNSNPIKIKAVDKQGNEFIFDSIRQCSNELNINRKTLSSILKQNKNNNYDYNFYILE